jgi:molybdenum cofactor cytidylyltransferase
MKPRPANIADLMQPPPRRWGLRGDPLLWEAMAEALRTHPFPLDEMALNLSFATVFEALTDHPLETAPEHLRVTWTRRENGGMSNGLVSGPFWRDTCWPLIRDRFAQARL